jgi:peptidoglycan/LPS O-acetylase OafA/YrhL
MDSRSPFAMISPRYRSDIDGLRAIAVLGVVIYHAFPMVLPGGFIGVDIFFVISGYLISGILYRGHREGNFSYGEFYARRIRRLFPALITMLVLCLAYGWWILLPDEFQRMGKRVGTGLVFIQNFSVWQETGYFDVSSKLKPLLHLWSLALEEQFYLLFPLLLLILWKKKRVNLSVMACLFAASLIACVMMSYWNRSTCFYLLPYRAWEFLGGGLLAWWHQERGGDEKITPSWREVISLLGIAIVIAGMTMLRESQPYPGWRALVPVAGTLLMIEGGKGAYLNKTLLSHPAVVWVGLISYPLYLFHWPILSYLHVVKWDGFPIWMIYIALGLSLALSVAVYYLIEKPLRYHHAKWVMPTLIASYVFTCATGFLVWGGWIPVRNARILAPVGIASGDKSFFDGLTSVSSEVQVFKVGGNGKQTLFIGDSNMMQYAPRVHELLKNNNDSARGAVFACYAGLPPIPSYRRAEDNFQRSLFPEIGRILRSTPHVDRVVIACLWPEYFTGKKSMNRSWDVPANTDQGKKIALESLESFMQQMAYSGRRVSLVLCVPYGLKLSPIEYLRRSFSGATLRKIDPTSAAEFLNANGYAELCGELTQKAANAWAEVIDPMDTLTHDGWCDYVDEQGIPIRYDHAHLRPGFVRTHVRYLDHTMLP